MNRFALILLMAVGCGDKNEPPPVEIDERSRIIAALSTGIDLVAPVAARVSPLRARVAKTIDLDTDRALRPIAVPSLPRGASTVLDLPEGQAGWVTHIPDSRQLPAAAYGDGKIYISGGFDSISFYGLDAETGRIDWATSNLEDNGPTAAIYEDDKVIFNTESCTLFALEAKTGKRLWYKWLGDPTLAQVAVADGLIYAAHPSAGTTKLSAYRVGSGATVWSRTIGGELLATPVIAGDSVYAATIHGTLFRFERETGERRWRVRARATTAPWISGDRLYIAQRGEGGVEQQVAIDIADGSVVAAAETSTGKYLADVPRSLANWRKVWEFEGSRPVVSHGVRYVALGGQIHATDAKTGESLWVRRYAPAADKRSVGSVAVAGPQVVISTRGGQLYGLDVDTGASMWAYDLDAKVVAQPIVARGWVYVTTKTGYVIGLQVADESLDGWHMFGGNPKHNGPVKKRG